MTHELCSKSPDTQASRKPSWLEAFLKNPWIRVLAIILVFSLVAGVAGHGLHLWRMNRAYAREVREQQALEEELRKVEALYSQALLAAGDAAQVGDYAQALESLNKCLALVEPGDPLELELLTTRGSLHVLLGEPQAALEDLDRVLEAKPDQPDLILLRAQTHIDLDDYEAAAEDLLSYLERRPGDPGAAETLAGIREAQGRYGEAAQAYALLTDRPGRLNEARCRILAGQSNDAQDLLTALLEQGPYADAFFLRGLCRIQLDLPEPAREDFTLAMEAGYDPALCLEQMGACCLLLSQYEQVCGCADEYLALEGPHGEISGSLLQQAGIAALNLEHYEAAEQYLTRALEGWPELPGTRYYRGLGRFARSLWPEAIQDLTAALEEDYLPQNCLYNRGICYAQLPDYDKALEDMAAAARLGTDPEISRAARDFADSLKEAIPMEN